MTENVEQLAEGVIDRAITRLQALPDYAGRHVWNVIVAEEMRPTILAQADTITSLQAQLDKAREALQAHQAHCNIIDGRVVSKYGPHSDAAFLQGAAALTGEQS